MSSFINVIKDHIAYKGQIFKLAKADLVKTYRGSALGWSWAIIKPAVTIFVYWFAFEIGLKGSKTATVNGYSNFLWLLAGLMPWFYMSDMLSQGTDSIRKYSYLVTKMKFPVSTIPTFVSISKMIVHFFLLAITIGIFFAFGKPIDIYIIQLPFFILLNFLFFTVFSLFSSLLSSMSKDFSNLVKSFITAVLWLSGILWDVNNIDIPWLKKLLMINPVTYIVNGYRNCFINKVWFWEQPKRLLYFVIILIALLVMAIWVYKKLRKEIPDVLS